jgi:protein TIF31
MTLDSRSIDDLLKFIEGSGEPSKRSKKAPGRRNPKSRGGAVVGAAK